MFKRIKQKLERLKGTESNDVRAISYEPNMHPLPPVYGHGTNIIEDRSHGGLHLGNIDILKKAFTVADKDANGFLSWAELKAFNQNYGCPRMEENLNAIYDKCYNGDRGELTGKFTFMDFVDLINALEAKADQELPKMLDEIYCVFSVVINDEDGDGTTSVAEMVRGFTKLGLKLDFNEIVAFINFLDGDSDGEITMEEIEDKLKDFPLSPGMGCVPRELQMVAPNISDVLVQRSKDHTIAHFSSHHCGKKSDIVKALGKS